MKIGFSLFILSFFVTAIVSGISRIGILAHRDAVQFSALLTAELSSNDFIIVVEREDLGVVEKEKLSAISKTNNHLAEAADALVLIESIDISGKKLFELRLVETQTGLTIWRHLIAADPFHPEAAKESASAIVAQAGRIGEVPADKLHFVSLLGLSFEVSIPDATTHEHNLNRLVSHHLGLESRIRVLERWKTKDLMWENSLSRDGVSEFEGGSLLVEGSLREESDELVAAIQLRGSGKKSPERLSVKGSLDSLNEFAKEIAINIAKSSTGESDPIPWDNDTEASGFRAIAEWALGNGFGA